MRVEVVNTPDNISSLISKNFASLRQLEADIRKNIDQKNNKWTKRCSQLLSTHLTALYIYDRNEAFLGRAFGNNLYKILVNPIMAFCYHPDCCGEHEKGSGLVRLKHIYDLAYYLSHLERHQDTLGAAMRKRFTAVIKDHFISKKDLDEICASPYSLLPINFQLNNNSVDTLESLAIHRGLNTRFKTEDYVCHWKNKLITENIIEQSSLTYQEDEALIYILLHFPNSVHDWSIWGSLSMYCAYFYSAISSAALNLYRGVTHNRLTKHVSESISDFIKGINHPGPSLTAEQGYMPELQYVNESFHEHEILFHIKLLESNTESVKLSYPNITRYLVTLGCDEQELNPGTYIIDEEKLHGLLKTMTAEDIKRVGLDNLPAEIAADNPFVTSAREYRLTDFAGFMCSNAFTSFEAGSMEHQRCIDQLKDVIRVSTSCSYCLLNNIECDYDELVSRCASCEEQDLHCTSLSVFHVLWDMGSCHVLAAKMMDQIDLNSSPSDYVSRFMFIIGFGGLHLAKAVVNCTRNHMITLNGQNYGLNILRCIKQNTNLLDLMKQAVMVAKDRQSDLLCFLSVYSIVQNALKEAKYYKVHRLPEPYMDYAPNAKSHKDIIFPTACAHNKNGDVFILDAGGACIWVIDRSTIAQMYCIGKYKKPNNESYGKNSVIVAKDARFSNQLVDMVIVDEIMYIVDCGRKEIIVFINVKTAMGSLKRKVHVLEFPSSHPKIVSVAHTGKYLILLHKDETGIKIAVIDVVVPKQPHKVYDLQFKLKASITPDFQVEKLFLLQDEVFGGVDDKKKICLFSLSDKGKKLVSQVQTVNTSNVKPCKNMYGQIITSADDTIYAFQAYINKKKQLSLGEASCTQVITDEGDVCCLSYWGDTLHYITLVGVNRYSLIQVGLLDFGLSLCRSIESFYHAISYTEPGFVPVEYQTLDECVAGAMPLVTLLTEVQESAHEKFETMNCFTGKFGAVPTNTFNCMADTVKGWESQIKRLAHFGGALSGEILTHTITNESWVEHSFGFTKKKGQGQLPDQKIYLIDKRKHALHFQMKMCDLPFCREEKTKVRDKGYQTLANNRKTKLSTHEFKNMFAKKKINQEEKAEVSDEDKVLVRKAYLLTKAVPRNSNRSKWKEKSGFQPHLGSSKKKDGMLVEGDMVFAHGLSGERVDLIVTKDVILYDNQTKINVKKVGEDIPIFIKQKRLLLEKGLILCIPKSMYSIHSDQVFFDDIVEDSVMELDNQTDVIHSDGEWTSLMDLEASSSKRKRNIDIDHPSQNKKSKKKKSEFDSFILHETWQKLLPPAEEKSMIDSWVACIYKKGNNHQLIFGQLKQRFRYDDDLSELDKCEWEVSCCKPFDMEVDFVEEVPRKDDGTPGELWNFSVSDIISSDIHVTYIDRGKWKIRDKEEIKNIFKYAVKVDCKKLMLLHIAN